MTDKTRRAAKPHDKVQEEFVVRISATARHVRRDSGDAADEQHQRE